MLLVELMIFEPLVRTRIGFTLAWPISATTNQFPTDVTGGVTSMACTLESTRTYCLVSAWWSVEVTVKEGRAAPVT